MRYLLPILMFTSGCATSPYQQEQWAQAMNNINYQNQVNQQYQYQQAQIEQAQVVARYPGLANGAPRYQNTNCYQVGNSFNCSSY